MKTQLEKVTVGPDDGSVTKWARLLLPRYVNKESGGGLYSGGVVKITGNLGSLNGNKTEEPDGVLMHKLWDMQYHEFGEVVQDKLNILFMVLKS